MAHRYARVERARAHSDHGESAPRWCRCVRSRCRPRCKKPAVLSTGRLTSPAFTAAVNWVSTRQSVLVTVYRVSRK